ncbi:MAG: DUF1501 domain-containing protein [Pirellulales bacterium]|nr:DUF1501 domain-containing protein [Pirellulales bacterium]
MRTPCLGPVRRREFLRAGVLGLGGLGLADLMQAQASGTAEHRDTSVILFWMWGGPSQLETYDLKPEAPSEYRGPFRPIPTTVPGLEVCELFPRQARLADKFSLVRSLHHEMSAHNDGSIEVLTGKTPRQPDPTSQARSEHPDFGMIAARCRGARADGLPNYVGIPRQPFMTQPNYLGVSQAAFATGDPAAEKFRAPNLELAAGLDATRLDDRSGLVAQFDHLRRGLDLHGSLEGTDDFRAGALRVLTSRQVATAFDLGQEEPRLRDRYGRHLWGQSMLLARRLAEAGTAVVTIDALAPTLSDRYFSWDDHINPQTRWDLADAMRYRAPFMDQGLSALIDDIHQRGLDQRIMVVAMGEFGRTPRLVNSAGLIGRDHWPAAMSALVAGGDLRMGQVVGATNSKGEFPQERPLTPQDLLATIYRHLGIDWRSEFTDFSGRPIPILPHGEPIRELI